MEQMQSFRPTLMSLFRSLTSDTKNLLRQEVQLAKTELSEKASKFGKNAAMVAVGGFIAYAGAIVLLIGIGWLIGWGLEAAGLSEVLARAIGLTLTGLIVVVSGYVMLNKSMKTMKSESLAPERTIQTLQEMKTTAAAGGSDYTGEDDQEELSAEQLQERVEATETRMGDTLDELGYRLSPSVINQQVKERISASPYQAGLIAMGLGLVSGLLIRSRLSSKPVSH